MDPAGIMRGFFRRVRPVLFAMFALGLLLGAYDCIAMYRWDGGYHVEVRVERQSDRPVERADATAMFRDWWQDADGKTDWIDFSTPEISVAHGSTFEVHVRSSGTRSGLGRDVEYVREELLILRVEYADGGREVVVAVLPESQSSREMVVKVP